MTDCSWLRSFKLRALLVLLIPLSLRAAGDEAARVGRVERGLLPPVVVKGRPAPRYQLAERMKFHGVPGVSVAFIEGGRIVWARAYGYADRERGIAVTTSTLFQAASLSKPVAAAAAMRLVQSGVLSLDADVNEALRGWKVPSNAWTKDQKVTLRRILSHSAGLGVGGFKGYASSQAVPSVVGVLDGAKPANSPAIRVEAVPGSRWSYSGGGYVILQKLLSDASGKPFPELLQEQVLGPAGMSSSAYEQPASAERSARAARPYLAGGAAGGEPHVYPELAAAGLWTTPSDYARFVISLQDSYGGKAGALLSTATAREMLTDQREGFGLGLRLPPGTRRLSHTGSNYGFTSVVQAYVEEGGQGVVIMTNGDKGGALRSEILRAVAAEYGWRDLLPAERAPGAYPPGWEKLAGAYGTGDDALTIAARGGKLWLEEEGEAPAELFAGADGRFFLLERAATYRFHAGGARLAVDDANSQLSLARTAP